MRLVWAMGIAATNNIIMIEWWNEMEHIAENNYMFIAVPTIWIVIYLSIYYWFSITKLFAVHAVMNIYIVRYVRMVPHPCMFLLIPVAPPIWYLSIVAQIIIKCITWLTTYIIIMPMNGFMNNQYVYAWSDEISLCFSWFWLMIDWMVWRWFCSPRATQHIMHVLTEQTYEFLMAARVLYTRDLQMRASKMKQKLLSIN